MAEVFIIALALSFSPVFIVFMVVWDLVSLAFKKTPVNQNKLDSCFKFCSKWNKPTIAYLSYWIKSKTQLPSDSEN